MRRAGARPHFLGLASSGLGPPEGIALLDQLLWVPLDRLCGILGEAQDSMAMVGTRCLPRGPVSRTDYVPAPTPPYTPARPLTCFLTLNIIIPFLYINFKESLIAMESSITHELVVSESRHNQFGASFPSDQRPSAVGKPVVYVYSWLFSVDSVFEMVSLYSLGLLGECIYRLQAGLELSEFDLLLPPKC